jgi:Family of unknown function (DUF6636)
MRQARIWLVAASLVAVSALAARPASADDSFFRSPTGNIGCVYAPDLGTLRCDVRDGVKPLPPMPKSCEYDWGQGFWLHKTGQATIVCAGDTALGVGAVLQYGSSWSRDGFSCASSSSGFRCKNSSGRGFFISRGEAYRF